MHSTVTSTSSHQTRLLAATTSASAEAWQALRTIATRAMRRRTRRQHGRGGVALTEPHSNTALVVRSEAGTSGRTLPSARLQNDAPSWKAWKAIAWRSNDPSVPSQASGDGFGWANDRDTLKLTPSVEEEQAEGCRPRKGRWRGGGEVTSHAGVLRTTVKGWSKGHVACEG